MKLIAKIICSLLFILSFVIFTLSLSLKFQILNFSFWQKTFSGAGTYVKVSEIIKNNLVTQTIKEGGRGDDVKVLADIFSPDTLKDFVENNIKNILDFINGGKKAIFVYIPVGKIPALSFSVNPALFDNQMKLADFLKSFNIQGISAADIESIRILGPVSLFAVIISSIIMIVILLILFKLTDAGKRFISIGVTFLLSGLILLAGYWMMRVLNASFSSNLLRGGSLASQMLYSVTPVVINAVSNFWVTEALLAIVLGLILFFLRKPQENIRK